jgi:hypothetical protein
MKTSDVKKYIAVLETVQKYEGFLDALVRENYKSAKELQKSKFSDININEFGLASIYNIEWENGEFDIDDEIARLHVLLWSGETE